MPTYHRSQRLRLVGTGPKVEQLQEGRFRLTFTCTATNPNEAWMNGNKDQIMTAYGTLQSAQKNIAGIDPRTDEAYSDMVLFRTEANPSERDLIITLVYETATTAFVKSQDDKIDFELNGLQRVTRITIAKTGTSLPSVTIGSTSITVDSTACKLASRSVEENDAFIQITEVYLQEGTVSESLDSVGSQQAKVITTFGTDPSTPTDYVLASKEESNFSGYQTNTFRFLKEDVQLSKSVDNQSPLKVEVQEWFKPGSNRDTKSDYSLINKQESNVGGIPTERYTFAKDGVLLSVTEDKVGSQNAIVNEIFNPSSESITGKDTDGNNLSGYSEVDRTESNHDGIKTIRVRFLKNNVTLSTTEDKVGSQLAIVKEVFNGTPSTPSGYSIASEQESNVDGIPTKQFRFLKNNVTLSTTEDKVGSQLAIVKEVFNGTPSTPSGYSIADEQISSVDGIPTRRFRFLKNDVVLSRSRDSVGSQKTVVLEVFNGDNEATDANSYGAGTGYVLAREEESNVDGIKTRRYTYLEPSILSVEESKNTPENRITVRVFHLASNHSSVSASENAIVDTDTHILVSQSDQDHAGIKTSVYVFESKDYCIKSTNEFGRTVVDRFEQSESTFSLQSQASEYTVEGVSNLRILNQTIQNDDNDVNKRITKFSTVGIDDVKEDIVGSQKAIVITKVGAEPTATEAASKSDIAYDAADDWSIAKKDNAREGGLDVYTYTFLLNNTILSESQDKKGSLKTNVIEVFNPKVTAPGIRVEGGSNIAGDYFLNAQQVLGKNYYAQKTGAQYEKAISYNSFTSTWSMNLVSSTFSTSTDVNPDVADDPPTTGWSGQGDSELFNMTFRDFDTTLPSTTNGISLSHRYEKEGYSLINLQKSSVDGIPTMRYTFARNNSIISVSEDKIGAQNAIVNEIFNPTSETITGVDSDNNALSGYSEADRTESDYDGIKTIRVRFLKNDSILSVSEDFVGSQKSIVNEVFNPHQDTVAGKDTANQALSGYSEASRTESNFSGIKTIRVTFLKDNVTLSQVNDFVGSQKSIVKEVFNPTGGSVPTPIGGYIEARRQESNVSGIPTKRITFLKPSILSVNQDFVSNTVSVQAFDRTSSEVTTALDEVTSGHTLVSQREQDHDGIVTQVYQYEITSSDLIDFTADDRLQVIRTIFQAHDYDYNANYTVGSTTATVNSTSVTLTALKVDSRGASGLMKLIAVFVQPKITGITPVMKTEYNTIPMYQYRSIVSSPKAINDVLVAANPSSRIDDPNGTDLQANAVFFEPTVNNTTSPVSFTQNVLNTSVDLDGTTTIDGVDVPNSTVISSHEDFYNFQMPGLINIRYKKFGREDNTSTSRYSYPKLNIETQKISHPISTKVKCTVYNFLTQDNVIRESDYNYADAAGLWSPNSWATVNMRITHGVYSYSPIEHPINNTYPGYRIEAASRSQVLERKVHGLSGIDPAIIIYNGINVGQSFLGMGYALNVADTGPPNPERKKWCLNVDIQPAFRDSSGTQYYNKQIVITETIQPRRNGSLVYS